MCILHTHNDDIFFDNKLFVKGIIFNVKQIGGSSVVGYGACNILHKFILYGRTSLDDYVHVHSWTNVINKDDRLEGLCLLFYVSLLVATTWSERAGILLKLVVTAFEFIILCNALDVELPATFPGPAAVEQTGGLMGVVISSILINCSMGINDSSPPGACTGACNFARACKHQHMKSTAKALRI